MARSMKARMTIPNRESTPLQRLVMLEVLQPGKDAKRAVPVAAELTQWRVSPEQARELKEGQRYRVSMLQPAGTEAVLVLRLFVLHTHHCLYSCLRRGHHRALEHHQAEPVAAKANDTADAADEWLLRPCASAHCRHWGHCASTPGRQPHGCHCTRCDTKTCIHHTNHASLTVGVFVYAFAEVDVCGVLVHVSEPKTETTNSGSRRSSMLVFLVDESEAVVAVEVRGSSAELMKAGLRVDSVVALQDITYRAYDGRTATHQCSWNDHAAVVAQSLPHVSTARATVSAWKSTAEGIECIDVSVVLAHTRVAHPLIANHGLMCVHDNSIGATAW